MGTLRKPRSLCRCGCGKESKLKNVFFSIQCDKNYRYDQYISRWLQGLENGSRGHIQVSHHIRKFLMKKHGERCQKCGWCEVNPTTGKIPLTLSRKDGNWQNNREENLEILCPNCHSLTSTYGALNKGKGRPRVRRELFLPKK